MSVNAYPVTPDGRYFIVRGRLWRCTNPNLPEATRIQLVHVLMTARSAKRVAMRAGDPTARELARQAIDAAKHALGERGPVWWSDGSPDLNRHLVHNTPYAPWYSTQPSPPQ